MESELGGEDEGGRYVPLPHGWDTNTYTELGDLTVDGETFRVRRRDNDGATQYAWISGPNDGYGFDSFGGLGSLGHEDHESSIRDFLSAIDPATGYFYDR